MNVRGQVALVTGAERNIGAAIAHGLAAAGACVVVNGLDPVHTESVAAEVRDRGGRAVAAPGDITDPDTPATLVDRAVTAFGGIHILVNNAALPTIGRDPFLDVDLTNWEASIAVAGRGTLACTQAAARHMSEDGGGAIVNISSLGGQRAHRGSVIYDAGKGAVDAATRALAIDLAPYGIRVNAIAPGAIANDRRALMTDQQRARQEAEVPLGRVGTGEDIAQAVLFLVSDAASYITGHVLNVDGGLSAQLRTPTPQGRPC